MNAAELLNHLVERGTGRQAPDRPHTGGVVAMNGFEVAAALDPGESSMRARWRERVGRTAASYLLVADDPEQPGALRVLGPASVDSPIRSVEGAALARAVEQTIGMEHLEAVRHLAGEVIRLGGRGLHMEGLLSRHTVEVRFKENRARWGDAIRATADLRSSDDWREVITKLGYQIKQLARRGYLACLEGRPVAVVHPKNSPQAFTRLDAQGRPPEGLLVQDCLEGGAPYGLLAYKGRFRLFAAGSTQEWLDIDADLLDDERRPFLALLSPPYLAGGGLADLREEARQFGAALRKRLDQTIRSEAFPALASGLDRWTRDHAEDIGDDRRRAELEQASLTLLFRLLFILYAEGSGFLPMDNATYRRKSLTGLVSEAVESMDKLSENSTALWAQFVVLTKAMRLGNRAWDVPAYNGSLFAHSDFEGAELLERLVLTDPHFARLLRAVGWDSKEGRGIDYSSLEIGHLGHIYEALLSLRLSLTDCPLRYDKKKDRYVPDDAHPDVPAGGLLWQTDEGGRKAGGVYYTPAELVAHLVRGAVEPAFERHLSKVDNAAADDPAAAAEELFSFSVLDPACGSAHFLVQVVETLADMTVRFLAKTPLPSISADLERLRRGASADAEIDDAALIRRLVLKRCVFGVDVSPMGAEIALMSLWLASFVPGLSLSYLDRNVIVGNSLIGVADPETVGSEGTMWHDQLREALRDAIAAVARLADIYDRTPEEVDASRTADEESQTATAGVQRLFDLWTAGGFGVKGAREHVEANAQAVISGEDEAYGQRLVKQAIQLGELHRFLHWALAFPRVFDPERGKTGFDVVVGNPPWKEVTIKELEFYGRYLPGINGQTMPARKLAIHKLTTERPELLTLLDQQREKVLIQRKALASGEYASMGGTPDLYKYFCQRYRYLTREGGFIGVVLPRSTFINEGSEGFRGWIYNQTTVRRLDFLKNKRNWAFLNVEARSTVALVTAEVNRPPDDHCIEISGLATSIPTWNQQSLVAGALVPLTSFGPDWMTPAISSSDQAGLLSKIRIGNPFWGGTQHVINKAKFKIESKVSFPIYELSEKDSSLWLNPGAATVHRQLWKGESFGQYEPHGAKARKCPESSKVWEKVRKSQPGLTSRVKGLVTLTDRQTAVRYELERARVAFCKIRRADDSRTIIACLVPPKVFLAESAPYMIFVGGDELIQSAYLGVMNSLPFDWQARRFIERNVNLFIIESLIVPRLDDKDFDAVARNAARLSAVDDRFADFAAAAGVEVGPLDREERQRRLVEIDALVARAWDLTVDDLHVMFDDFTTDAVPEDYRVALTARLVELT